MPEKTSTLTVSRRVMREWQTFRTANGLIPQVSHAALWALTRMDVVERFNWIEQYHAWRDWVPESTDAAAAEGRKS